MAYTTLVSLERTIDQILDHNRFSISSDERKQIIYIDKCVVSFQAFLENFPEKSTKLEARIRDVAVEAEDIIEWFMWKQIRYSSIYTKWIAMLTGIMFLQQLRQVSDKMDSIVPEMENNATVKDAQLGDSQGTSSSSQVAYTGKTIMVDLNEDLIEIKARLCGEAPQLQVLPIFGMGGIGKTTLARNAYCDELIMEHFQIRAWITISQDYNVRRILLELLDSMKEFDPEQRKESLEKMIERSEHGNESAPEISEHSNEFMEKIPKHSNECEMAVKVHKILTGRRFLIVMDDMWSTRVLDNVRNFFPNNNNGSRIMLTTRLTDVATYANSFIPFHEMRLMDEDQSWTLLRQKVFAHQNQIPRELESCGREIARSCGGLPLALTVIAGVLSNLSKTLTTWKQIAKNVKQSLPSTVGQIEEILSLSYSHLPLHLRSCFLYMAAFPEDHEVKATDLTRLWIAEGFVKPEFSKRFEDSAEEYLEALVNRSLIIVKKRNFKGKIKYCSLHDMVREMCMKLSQKEKFLVHRDRMRGFYKSIKDQRRISISHSYLDSFTDTYSSTIRTILYFNDKLDSFRSFRLLRVLDILRVHFDSYSLPHQIFELFHLRYLAFSYYGDSIGREISKLQNLETLIIKSYSFSCGQPCPIWNFRQLRHFICSDNYLADPNGVTFALENLQTLGVCDLECSISVLNMIPNLKKLRLKYSWGYFEKMRLKYYWRYKGDSFLHNLVHLRQLETLHLELKSPISYDSGDAHNLVVPSSLKKLTLICWSNNEKYLNIVGPFPNLEVLKLKTFNFKQQEWSSNDEDFPQLKYLLISQSNLSRWTIEGSHFPRLQQLLIHSCLNLTEIPDGIGEIPTLELIELNNCRKSLADSAKQMEEDARDYGYDNFRVRCVDPIQKPSMPTSRSRPRSKRKFREPKFMRYLR